MATYDADFSDQMRGPSLTIWLVGATVILFLAWSKFATLDQIVRSNGEVISASRPQIIQNLEGGLLAELTVSEGDIVEEGQILAKLQGTQFATNVADLEEQILATEVRRLRLAAEIAGAYSFEVPSQIASRIPQIVASELALINARQSDHAAKVTGAQSVLTEISRELDAMEDMLKRDIVSLMEVTPARKRHTDAQNRLAEIVNGADLDRAAAYSDTLQELAGLAQDLRLSNDRLQRTVIRAPMRGIVNNLGVTTIGGVVRPGDEILQLTPIGDALFVEAHVRPEDIANVVQGQAATIKLTAYDYTVYGSLTGHVEVISADTFKDENRPDIPPHFKVTLRVDSDNLSGRQRDIRLRPGLQATVELHTGQRTVLQYLTKPLYRGGEALQEP